MIDQKDIELALEIAKQNLIDMDKIDKLARLSGVMPFEIMREDIGIQIAALSRIASETKNCTGITPEQIAVQTGDRELWSKLWRLAEDGEGDWRCEGKSISLIDEYALFIRADERKRAADRYCDFCEDHENCAFYHDPDNNYPCGERNAIFGETK